MELATPAPPSPSYALTGVPDEHAARLSPLLDRQLNVHGRYTFTPAGLPTGALRPLRDPADPDPDE